ncbi:threonine ammonia-lyase [Jannaschia ovalis]|uniref:Threonine/serine dehydratase n=1 Tax=Jannaschia ovalis TaxID=3038773 RepID=A0ABY8LEN8_9RHOB|nr:threonine/serine dehydratase [Jannaschia sp. GRR-S6-38]WGH79778.1 threonine/serine dehydratase [Jannaschia sp. GRR-S6-38]
MDDAALEAVTRADIEAAAARLAGHAVRTPLIWAPSLDAAFGRRIRVKAECLQLTGSFKFRGAFNAVAQATGDVVALSSGNHAQGVALAAQMLGRHAVIVMPADAPRVKIENTRGYGAEVMLYDRATEDRDAIGARLATERGLDLISPFDDPRVIAGQGTCGLEVAEDLPEGIAELLVCCGGGGLSAGCALALEGRATVRTVEPAGFDDYVRSLAAGRRVENAARTGSICDAILSPRPGALTFPILQRLAGPGMVVTDAEALRAMRLAFEHLRIVLEPGGAVALAAALFHHEGDVAVTASGGNVDAAMFARALKAD